MGGRVVISAKMYVKQNNLSLLGLSYFPPMHPPETASSPAPLRFLFPPPLMVMTFLTETSSWGGGGVDDDDEEEEEEEEEEGRWRTFTACFSTSCWNVPVLFLNR